jgi:hypothetical protein
MRVQQDVAKSSEYLVNAVHFVVIARARAPISKGVK